MGDLTESKGSYETRHKDFSGAMKHAYDYAKRAYGITINPSEIDDKVATGPKKPSRGKTNKYRLKGDRGTIQVQVYNDGNRYELNMYKEDLQEQIEGLKKKSEKSGIPYGILKTVYDRGMAAYKTGHRPGATAQQWAFARVNSFITKGKGTWGGADKDLAAKVKGSTKSEQAPCWDGYKQVGMKTKGNKMVPDCVPEGKSFSTFREEINEISILTEAKIEDTFVKLAKELADQANKKLPPREKDGKPQFTGVSYPITMTGGGRNGRVWTRGDGSKYRKPAKIVSDLDHSMYAKVLKDYKKLMGGTPVDMTWKFITSKGKSLGKATGEHGSDKPAPAYQWNGTVFIKRGSESIDIVTPSIFRNSWVWRTVKEGVELDEASMTDDDWVVVGKGRKPVRFLKNPKNNKAPRNWQKSSAEKEVMRVSKAKQMGLIESLSGAENPPFKSKAGAGEFGTDKLEKTYRKDTPGQSEEVEEMDMKERANKPPKIKRNRGPYTQAQIQKASKHLSPMARTKLMGNLAQMTEELEPDIYLDEKIKCPSCDGKGCDHCGGSGYHKESDVEEAIRTKAAQRDELKRREKISTALKGKPQKKTFSSMRSRLTKEESEQVQESVTVSRKDFDSMKKGDVVNVVFNSSIKKGHKVKLKVKSKTRSAKYDVDKINMVDASDPRNRTKFTFYSRQGKDATLAWGDMGTTLQSYKVESFDAVSEAHCSSSKKKITDEDVAQFIGAASAAKKDGKKEFKFGGKTYPVTISGDTAKKVLEDSFEESFDVSSLIESSDKTDAKEMSAMIKELEPKISPSKLKKEVEKMAMSKYKNKSRAKKISSFV